MHMHMHILSTTKQNEASVEANIPFDVDNVLTWLENDSRRSWWSCM
jgi:hypothetical protein